jgi:hypothetical protein
MIVGDDVAIIGDDEAGPKRTELAGLSIRNAEMALELSQKKSRRG